MEDAEVRPLLDAIFEAYSYDFRDYSPKSLRRRLRVALSHFDAANLAELRARILRDSGAFLKLVQYMTIPTSDLFRDPGYYLAVRRQVVPVLRTYPSLKIWVAGCSTGEEVYSLAILLREEGLLSRTTIYATDINPVSLAKAEAGIYPFARLVEADPAYRAAGGRGTLAEHYVGGYDSGIMDKSLRSNVVFADHSLATDHVFSEVQLVSCRNVLIYFNRTLQDRALGLFHASLSHRAFLGLGAKETLRFGRYERAFEALAAREKIYRRR